VHPAGGRGQGRQDRRGVSAPVPARQMRPRTLGRPLAPRHPRRAAGRRSAARSSRVARRVSRSLKAPPCFLSAVRPRTPLVRAALPRAPTCAASACAASPRGPQSCRLPQAPSAAAPAPPPASAPEPPSNAAPARPLAGTYGRTHAGPRDQRLTRSMHLRAAPWALATSDRSESSSSSSVDGAQNGSAPTPAPAARVTHRAGAARGTPRASPAAAGAPRLRRRLVRGSALVWGMEHAGRANRTEHGVRDAACPISTG
jgi:hypothetical protein